MSRLDLTPISSLRVASATLPSDDTSRFDPSLALLPVSAFPSSTSPKACPRIATEHIEGYRGRGPTALGYRRYSRRPLPLAFGQRLLLHCPGHITPYCSSSVVYIIAESSDTAHEPLGVLMSRPASLYAHDRFFRCESVFFLGQTWRAPTLLSVRAALSGSNLSGFIYLMAKMSRSPVLRLDIDTWQNLFS